MYYVISSKKPSCHSVHEPIFFPAQERQQFRHARDGLCLGTLSFGFSTGKLKVV